MNTTTTTAARALQRLSAKTRWAKLSPEARAEVMRTVRAARSELVAVGRIDTTSEPPPKKQSAPAITRARKPRRNTPMKKTLLLAAMCGSLSCLAAESIQAKSHRRTMEREAIRQTGALQDQAMEMTIANSQAREANRTPEERARIAETQKRSAEQAKLQAVEAARNKALRAQYGLRPLPPGYDERYKITQRQIAAIEATRRFQSDRSADQFEKDAPKREAWLAARADRKAEAAKLP